MWDWIFLDVGNVLLDEDPLTFFSFLRHVQAVRHVRPDLGFLDLLAAREARAEAGSRWPVYEVISAYLDDPRCGEVWEATASEVRARFSELSPPVTGSAAAVARLARCARLGLIANQPCECRARLAELGMLAHFEVVALAEEEGVFKPDPTLFLRAIERAGTHPSACLMVGDRLDDDLAPASPLGMSTAWLRWPRRSAKGWDPGDVNGRAYLQSLERTASLLSTRWEGPQPRWSFDTLADLAAAFEPQ